MQHNINIDMILVYTDNYKSRYISSLPMYKSIRAFYTIVNAIANLYCAYV